MEALTICLKNNRKTLIHCYGGIGRSCLVAACLLLYLSDTVSPQQAIDSLRDLRGSGAIQTIKVRRLPVSAQVCAGGRLPQTQWNSALWGRKKLPLPSSGSFWLVE
ncbi:cyclin dependent kinase inhibitor 3 [Phyllostomus discolor]|uniref:protein-tyrosine-phosphatase n=1 Tax=Phyllostomus discolor TaxID=89673 RepID=A0A834ETZ0_9CHIR|nr:cyclin dependent kinase inhibitor 3 [Phyllostomus discolor]